MRSHPLTTYMESVKVVTSYAEIIAQSPAVSSALCIVCVSPGSNPASGTSKTPKTAAHVQRLHLGYDKKKALPSVAYVPQVLLVDVGLRTSWVALCQTKIM